jgi:hypothetical protein
MKQKPYWEMTAQELAEATRQFDQPFVTQLLVQVLEKELARNQ